MSNKPRNYRSLVNAAGAVVVLLLLAIAAGLGWAGWHFWGGWGLAIGGAAGVLLLGAAVPVLLLLWGMIQRNR